MKKILLIINIIFIVSYTFAQIITGGHSLKKASNMEIIRNFKTNPIIQNSRSTDRTFVLDYDAVDEGYASLTSTNYNRYTWPINRRFPNDSTFVTRWGAVVYDTLFDFSSNPIYPFDIYPLSATQLTLDSLYVYYGHINVSGMIDTIVITVYSNDSLNSILNSSGIQARMIWTDTIYTDTSLVGRGTAGGPGIAQLAYAPGLILPRGSTFSVQMDYYGPVEDECFFLAGYREACMDPCGGMMSQVGSRFGDGKNSFSLFVYNSPGGTSFQSMNHDVSLDCNANGMIEDNLCEKFYIQNIMFQPIVTANINPCGIIRSAINAGCYGESSVLELSAYGFASTPTYSWSPSTGLSDTTIEDPVFTIGTEDSIIYTCTITDGIDTFITSIMIKSINCLDGLVYVDLDSNCIYDTTDLVFRNIPIILSNSIFDTTILSSDYYGHYYSYSLPDGNYVIRPDTTDLPYSIICPITGYDSISIDSSISTYRNINFALKCKEGFDVGTTGFSNWGGGARIGTFQAFYLNAGDFARVYNLNCSYLSGKIVVDYSGPISYISPHFSTLAPDSILPNRLVWNIADFSTHDYYGSIWPLFYIDSTAMIGDLVCFTTEVTPSIGDRVPSNNTFSQCFDMRTAYDPNYKEVSPSGSITSSQDWMYYTIHFQNLGNSYAANIYVWDTIDTNLNLNTIQVVGSSHSQFMQVHNNNRSVLFNFQNIMLQDSATNEPESHGWVQYRIKQNAGLAEGVQIHNTASILFDLNTPIVTNTVTNRICNTPSNISQTYTITQGQSIRVGTHTYTTSGRYTDVLSNINGCDSLVNTTLQVISGIAYENPLRILMYPNPAYHQVLIQLEGVPTESVNIIDMYGRKVFESDITTNKYLINTESWSNGTYIIQCGNKRGKLVVSH